MSDNSSDKLPDQPELVDSLELEKEQKRTVFEKARKYVQPGTFFKLVSWLYAERKLVVFFWVHFVATMVIWSHFALIKFEEQQLKVKPGAPRFWWKRLAPPLEFGSMHAILFQLALLPLSMARFSIANLSSSALSKFVPLNRMLRIHIHLGYTMVTIVFLATCFFFAFFGLLCSDGDQSFCDKFTEEIMLTGYGILVSLIAVGVTSYFRYKIPYEVFYIVHHLVFVMYILAIAHTLDVVERRGDRNRSQNFRWFTGSILYYICDRAAMYIQNRYRVPVVASAVINASNGARMVVLKIRRPPLFTFKPGQYAFLKMDAIEPHWHPFSIASGPRSDTLDFYIEVFKDKSWTGKLFEMLEDYNDGSNGTLWMQVMGPYGTPLANVEEFSHCLSIGSGTGVVPVLSLLQQHVRQMLRLQPEQYLRELEEHEKHSQSMELAREPRKGSLASKLVKRCRSKPVYMQGVDVTSQHNKAKAEAETDREDDDVDSTQRSQKAKKLGDSIARHSTLGGRDRARNMAEIKKAADREMRSIQRVVFLTIMPVIGVALFSFAISWNTTPIKIHTGMSETLAGVTILFQVLFALNSIVLWDGNSIFTYVDVVMCILAPFSDWFYFHFDNWTSMTFLQLFGYLVPIVYMTVRVWNEAVKSRHQAFRRDAVLDGITTLNKLEFVWVTRSAVLVSEMMPDINAIWDNLVSAWGAEYAQKVLSISVYITDKDEQACEILKKEMGQTDLFRRGKYEFRRPNFARLVEDHTLDLAVSTENSYSLMAFCGSPQLASELHRIKVSNDMTAAITGNKYHQMEFVAESYGGYKPPSEGNNAASSATVGDKNRPSMNKSLSSRRVSSVAFGSGALLPEDEVEEFGA